MGWDMGGGAWWGASLMVLFWIGLIVAVVLVVRAIDRPDRRGYDGGERREPGSDARQILDARFARGEISKEEYEERSQVLSRSR